MAWGEPSVNFESCPRDTDLKSQDCQSWAQVALTSPTIVYSPETKRQRTQETRYSSQQAGHIGVWQQEPVKGLGSTWSWRQGSKSTYQMWRVFAVIFLLSHYSSLPWGCRKCSLKGKETCKTMFQVTVITSSRQLVSWRAAQKQD